MIPLVRGFRRRRSAGIDAVTKRFWLDAADYPTGLRPASFVDAGNVGVTVTHTAPNIGVSVINDGGAQAFQFATVDGYFSFALPAGSCDLWLVGTPNQDAQMAYKFGTSTLGSHFLYSDSTWYDDTFASSRVAPGVLTPSVRQLLRVRQTVAGGRQHWRDGALLASVAGAAAVTPTTCRLGIGSADPTGTPVSAHWGGRVHEVIVLNEAESNTANVATIKAYLAPKYGLTIA